VDPVLVERFKAKYLLAHANMILFSLNAYTTIAGTSTYTFTAGCLASSRWK
jgi:hypothetical protein